MNSDSVFETLKLFEQQHEEKISQKILNKVFCFQTSNDHGDSPNTREFDTGVSFSLEQWNYIIQHKLFQAFIEAQRELPGSQWKTVSIINPLAEKAFILHFKRPSEVTQLLAEKKSQEILNIIEDLYSTFVDFRSLFKKHLKTKNAQQNQKRIIDSIIAQEFPKVLIKSFSDCLPLLKEYLTNNNHQQNQTTTTTATTKIVENFVLKLLKLFK